MIAEIPGARQVPDEPRRRWFSGGAFDLIVWLDESSRPIGFQLCYRRLNSEWAYTWHAGSLLSVNRIDDGEGRPGRFKMSPVLVPDGTADTGAMMAEFRAEAAAVPAEYRALVEEAIAEARR